TTASPGPVRPARAETPAVDRREAAASVDRYAWPPLKTMLLATARSGGRSLVARTLRNAATQMSIDCNKPTSAAACHTGRGRTAAKNTAVATLTFSLMLT